MRINKWMTNAGICSRRETNRIIDQGRLKVNDQNIQHGQWLNVGDVISLDGQVLEAGPKVYLIYNKPPGVVCSMNPDIGGNIAEVFSFLPYVFPVGRLDKASQGLMLLTNDGALADAVLRDTNHHEKEYKVTVAQALTRSFLNTLAGGVDIFGQMTRPCQVIKQDTNTFHIILTQGINRQIRKMCKKFGYDVIRLERVRFVTLALEDLGDLAWRHLTHEELSRLKAQVAYGA